MSRTAEQFHHLVERTATGLVVLDSRGTVRYANPAAAALLAETGSKEIGRHLDLPLDKHGVSFTIPMNGGLRLVELQAAAVEWEGREARVASLRDITDSAREREVRRQAVEERDRWLARSEELRHAQLDVLETQRRAKRELRESEQRLRLALESSKQGIWDLDLQTLEARVTPEYAAMLGFDPAGFRETYSTWIERLHPQDRELAVHAYREHAAGRSPEFRIEARMRERSGRWKWILSAGRIVERSESGLPLRMLGTHADISLSKQHEDRLEFLAHRAKAMLELPGAAERMDETAFLRHSLEIAEGLTQSRVSFLHFVHDDERTLELAAWSRGTLACCGAVAAEHHIESHPAGLWAEALRSREPAIANDYHGHPLKRELPEAHVPLTRFVCVPVLEQGKVRMLVGVGNSEAEYGAGDVETLRLVGDEIWHIVRRLRSEQSLRASESRYRRLFRDNPNPMWVYDTQTLRFLAVNDAAVMHYGYSEPEFLAMTIADIRPPEDVPRLRENVARVTDGAIDKAGAWRHLRRDGNLIEVEITSHALLFEGRPAELVLAHDITERRRAERERNSAESKFRALVEQSLVGVFMLDGDAIAYTNRRAAEIFGYAQGEMDGKSLLPLIAPKDRPVVVAEIARVAGGWQAVGSVECVALRKDGSEFMIGAQATLAEVDGAARLIGMVQDITDKRRAAEIERRHVARLEQAMMGTIAAVSRMMDLRDPYTAGHERRVGELAAAIGAQMGWSAERQQGLRVAGAVHDIGKITVPAEILSKPGRLSAVEFEIIKIHPQQGYEVLKDIDFSWPVAEVALQHHERLDGSGYPRGLTGDQIVPEARVLAVADVVESMASHRPYRPTLGTSKALEEIERNAGRLYDAQAVAACLWIFRNEGYRLPD